MTEPYDTEELIRLAQLELDEIAKGEQKWNDRIGQYIESANQGRRPLRFINGDALGHNAKPPNYLIQDILETDSMGMLAGASGAYKSFLSLAIAHSICTGSDFFGRQVYGQHKVMYICGEGESALGRRIKAIQLRCGDFNNNLMPLEDRIKIDDEDDIKDVAAQVNLYQPALVIFDTFASLNSKTNENDNSEVSNVLSMLNRHLRNGHTTSMVVHHFGKDSERGIRGASAFSANVDFVFSMAKDKNTMQTTLSCKKMKDGEDFEDLNLLAHKVPLGIYGQNNAEVTSLVLSHYDGMLAEVKPDNNTVIMMEYDRLLKSDPRHTHYGDVGVNKKLLQDRFCDVTGAKPGAIRTAFSRFKDLVGDENYIEYKDLLIITRK